MLNFGSGISVSTKNKLIPNPFGEIVDSLDMSHFGESHYPKLFFDITIDITNAMSRDMIAKLQDRVSNAVSLLHSGKELDFVVYDPYLKHLEHLNYALNFISQDMMLGYIINFEIECDSFYLIVGQDESDDRYASIKLKTVDGIFYEMIQNNWDNIPKKAYNC